MKRKILALLLSAAMLTSSFALTVSAAEVTALPEEDSFRVVQNSDGSCTLTGEPLDNEALYDRYVDELFGIEDDTSNDKLPAPSGRIIRDEVTEAVIKVLGKYIAEVAEGTRTSTQFYMTYDELSQYVSNPDLIAQWDCLENGKSIYASCLADYEPQMYWFDNSAGITLNNGKYTLVKGSSPVDCVYLGFKVIPLYSVTGEKGTFDVNPEASATAHIAISNALDIVKKYTRNDTMYSDYFVLKSFKDEIQSLATYDDDAAGNYDTGHPAHQMLNVFDGDPTTNVVCEGFSRAFKFLCDNYKFHIKVTCVSVCGFLSYIGGSGGHRWNLVQIGNDDNNRYLVDVTNDKPGQDLFMVGTSNAHYGSGDDIWYSFPNGFKYSYDRKQLF